MRLKPWHLYLLLTIVTAGLWAAPVHSQTTYVYGIFFYSPTCPHCHEVIDNHWPLMQEEFGDQLRVLFVDASTAAGAAIMQQARDAMHIQASGVPMLIMGEHVLVGSFEIPAEAPGIVRAGLQAGGIGLPPIPGIESVFQAALQRAGISTEIAETEQTTTAATLNSTTSLTLLDRLQLDPVANALAVVVLLALIASLAIIGLAEWRSRAQQDHRILVLLRGRLSTLILGGLSLAGAGMAASLLIGAQQEPLILALAGGILLVFIISLFVLSRPSVGLRQAHVIGLVLVCAGLAVAGYLAYVEVSVVEAVCGTVGNCNTVQQSDYARLLNIPIGVLGVVGYLIIGIVWLLREQGLAWANRALLLLTLAGAGFSAYLTFLEPFVIGATCMWCLSSAVVMLLLLWLVMLDEAEETASAAPHGTRKYAL